MLLPVDMEYTRYYNGIHRDIAQPKRCPVDVATVPL